ncbi:hypothetical protein Sjap_003449 [Stephania japonica]|uniref:BHLH domain-containing protein n=1 Tax=Stephania japonica TaxID=461633 RepID=A0AAP0KR74_9MAGN
MADEFHQTTAGTNWWNSSRNTMSMTLPCSTVNNEIHGGGRFGWATADQMVVEAAAAIRSSNCEDSVVSVSGSSSVVLQDAPKPQGSDSVSGGGGNILMDSTLQMMGYGLSSSSMDWSQALLSRNSTTTTERTRNNNFHSMFQEGVVESPVQVQRDHWSSNNCSNNGVVVSTTDSSFKQTNQGFVLDQHRSTSSESSVTCQGLPTSFSLDSSVSYGCPPSTLFQGLLESDLQAQQSPYGAISPSVNYGMIMNDLSSPTWPRFPHFLKTSSPPKQQQIVNNQLNFSNNTPYWNAVSTASPPPNSNNRPSFYPSSQAPLLAPTFFEGKPTCNSNLTLKHKPEEVRNSSSVMKKGSSEPATKKPRVDTPSPLPTFKPCLQVRKEKLGDRITALQQLVSPFGKTDTASVLFEAIEYIKFLHDQVSALSAPYMKNAAIQQQQHQSSEKSKEGERPERDLRSRGLCLVPISSTFPVTNETTADFWTPTFGGTFR